MIYRVMAEGLSARQTQILKSVIDDYIKAAEPVGSANLEKKHDLGISPATIRKEMKDLTDLDYLRQPHTSAGRVPTPKAMKFYINQLMEEKEMSLAEEVKTKEEVKGARDDFDNLMQEATQGLAKVTHSLVVAAMDDGSSWRWGYSNVYRSPEFSRKVCEHVFSAIEEARRLHELFFERLTGDSAIEVLFGEELGWSYFDPVGVVAARFSVGDKEGAIAVVGPFSLNYQSVIPAVRYFGNLITEVAIA